MSPQEHHWPSASGWREFFDLLSDAVVVLDAGARVVIANTAALRLLPCEVRLTVDQFNATLGVPMVRWLRHAAIAQRDPGPPPPAKLPDGRALRVTWRRLDAQHAAMHIAPEVAEPPATMAMQRSAALTLSQAGMHETIAFLWESPFPALLQDDDFRILDVNQPFLDLIGRTREETIGRDPLDWRPPEDRAATLAARERLHASRTRPAEPALVDSRLIDSSGRERRYRAARRTLVNENGMHLYLAVLQDTTGEHLAREGAERSLRELEEWFDLSPVGMVLSDQRGLLVRTNPAFDALAGTRPVSFADAPAGLRELLGWSASAGAPHDQSRPPTQQQGWVTPPGQDARLLRASVRSYRTTGSAHRTMAVIEDVTQLQEREQELEDLAREVTTQADRTRSILDSVLVGIVIVGPQGIEWLNRSARRMFAGELVDFVNLPIATVATSDADHPFRVDHFAQLAEGQAETFECRVAARDGRTFRVAGNVMSTMSVSSGRQLTYALLDIERRRAG